MSGLHVPREIANSLDLEERIIWVGRPTSRLFATSWYDFLIIPFGLIFAGAALMFQVTAVSTGHIFPFFFVIPHLFIGIYIAGGRFFVSRYFRKNMTYAVSNRRAYILSRAFSGRFIQKPLTKSVSIDYSPGQEATIRLDPGGGNHLSMQWRLFWPSHTGSFEFFRIPDGETVMALLRQVQREQS